MSAPKIVTITNPFDLIMAQIYEVSTGNAAMRQKIEECQDLLNRGIKEEAKLQRRLDKLLAKHKAKGQN